MQREDTFVDQELEISGLDKLDRPIEIVEEALKEGVADNLVIGNRRYFWFRLQLFLTHGF